MKDRDIVLAALKRLAKLRNWLDDEITLDKIASQRVRGQVDNALQAASFELLAFARAKALKRKK